MMRLKPVDESIEIVCIFSGFSAATFSMSIPPSVEVIIVILDVLRSTNNDK